MLAPETRVLLTDALRPPDGYRVDVAVATSYSLDLTALLLAPLSFALFDQVDEGNLERVDPIRLLEAVRRHSEHTTVFCQAGAIAVPSNYRSILSFVEDSVREVMPPSENRVFHPKIWALRFVNRTGEHLHRFICLSRNLTIDRSWDTALRLDEQPDTQVAVDTAPISSFLEALPSLGVRKLDDERAEQLRSLADTFSAAQLAPPPPFTSVELLPLGIADPTWPFPADAERVLAISPFLDKTELRRLAGSSHNRVIVSRPETLDRLGSAAMQGWQSQTLQRLVEVEIGDDVGTAPSALNEWERAREGLHAKTFVLDVGSDALVVAGSANLTGAAWNGNVEFGAVLRGPVKDVGVAAVLDGTADAPGLARMLEDYVPATAEGVDDAAQETSWTLELFHQRLAASLPELHITRLDDERVGMRLALHVEGEMPGETVLWPASLPRDTHCTSLRDGAEWSPLSLRNVTPFLAVETVAGEGEARAVRRCVIEASLVGDTAERRRDAVAEILRSKDDVLRYLMFLLGDPSYAALLEQLTGDDAVRGSWGDGATRMDAALFEPLVRATGRDTDALARVASLVGELRELRDGQHLVPEGFQELWDVVWEVHQEAQS